jgi:hypothetical protein
MTNVTRPVPIVCVLPNNIKAYEGKHGWYSVSYERYLELKDRHKKLLKTYLYSLEYWRVLRKSNPDTLKLDAIFHLAPPVMQTFIADIRAGAVEKAKGDGVIDRLLHQKLFHSFFLQLRKMYLIFLKEYVLARRPQPKETMQPFVLLNEGFISQNNKTGKMTLAQYHLMLDLLGLDKGLHNATASNS